MVNRAPRLDSSFPDVAAEIRQRIGEVRREYGLTQKQVADALGVAVRTFARTENGHSAINAVTLWAIARAIGAPIEAFFPPPTA